MNRMFKFKLIFVALIFSTNALASWNSAKNIFDSGNRSQKAKRLILALTSDGYYHSAMPLMKEYLITGTKNLDSRIDSAFSKMISVVGVKKFETLPYRFLMRSRSNNTYYIIAKKYLRDKDHARALSFLKKISSSHEIYPYALNMMGTIYSITGKTSFAIDSFRMCTDASNRDMPKSLNRRKLKLNRDYCVVGKARAEFGNRNFTDADLLYLDIPKSSMIWPEILFEEAWNSYYQKNYNRTLGKLVSYKAPVFSYIFNPEIDVLNALSYLKLCLFQDVKSISDNFYSTYLRDAKALRRLIVKNKRRYRHYYELMYRYNQLDRAPNRLIRKIFNNIKREEAYKDLKKQYRSINGELNRLRNKRNSRFKRFILGNLQESVASHKTIQGAYIRSKMIAMYSQLYKAFQGMSYIKLEVLAQRKAKLYSFEEKTDRERGDLKYIKRNEKQYFWDFNGEFWADELGDYVFALKSEC